MAKIGLPKGSGKRLKVREKSGNFEMDIEWQPCVDSWFMKSRKKIQMNIASRWSQVGPWVKSALGQLSQLGPVYFQSVFMVYGLGFA